jgi:SAM-dependent methyltransferase
MLYPWYMTYFGDDYRRFDRHEDTDLEVEGLTQLLGPPADTVVLDLGCGYGRHAIPLSSRGYRLVGCDLSRPLLTHGRRQGRGMAWVRGDMRALPFREAFHGVISLFTSLGYFEDETDNFSVFREVAAVLRPGGRFIVQMVNRDYLVRHFRAQEIHRDGDLLVLEERTFDPVSSHVETVTTVIEKGQTRRYTSAIRVYTVTELDMLLAAAGLVIREVFGGFDFRPYGWDTNQLVLIAEKPV